MWPQRWRANPRLPGVPLPYDCPMFEISVQRTFSAAHALVVRGVRETLHGHDWRLTAVVAGDSLDEDGLLCDFHAIEAALDEVIAPLRNANLNEVGPFRNVNPSAEQVARHVAQRLAASLPPDVRLSRVSVTEAPGCEATYVPL